MRKQRTLAMPPAWLARHVAFAASFAAVVTSLLALPLVMLICGALSVLGLADGWMPIIF